MSNLLNFKLARIYIYASMANIQFCGPLVVHGKKYSQFKIRKKKLG